MAGDAPLASEASQAVDAITARLLGSSRTMRRRDISTGARVSGRSSRRFWHALGFPTVREEDTVFTEADLGALQSVVALVRRGVFTEDEALAMTRALGRSADRLAVWQTQLMAEAVQRRAADEGSADGRPADEDSSHRADLDHHDRLGTPDPDLTRQAAAQLAEMADALEPLLVYAWRRHLGSAISRMIADAEPAQEYHGVRRTVGFADLVSFTELVRRSTERGLSRLVQRFEALSSDVIAAHGGRVVKTVGDEVLFQSHDPVTAGRIAVDLVRAIGADELLPEVRVGMSTGRVVPRLGDLYGTTVNRAARLTAQAPAGTVIVDDDLAEALGRSSPFVLTRLEPRLLHGIGEVTPYRLEDRPAQTGEAPEGDR